MWYNAVAAQFKAVFISARRAEAAILKARQEMNNADNGTLFLKTIPYDLTVCKVASMADIDTGAGFFFIGRTDEEISLVCPTPDTPAETTAREDGWRGFRIEGQLDFSLIGILSKLSSVLAENGIGIFAVSTYNTDYVLVKSENFGRAQYALERAGYRFL